jgi:hypothetical protein
MDGILFVTCLLAGVSAVGIRARHSATAPGLAMVLVLAAASFWYLFQ